MLDDVAARFRLLDLEAQACAVAAGPALALEADWRTWLPAVGTRTFTGSFAPFHCEFWDWYWGITKKRRRGEPLTDEETVFLAVWARGFAKSSSVEWAAIAEGALVGSGFVLYVSGTQALAEGHVQAIRERIESEDIARYYPHLANPQVGRHGNQYGWRQDFLRTAGGWSIRPLGLDVGVRGGRVGDMRPSLIIFDDVDDHTDSPLVVQKKLDTIARSIIPAGTRGTVILGAQNLIHRNSCFNQILTRRTSILSQRIVSGPYPAFEGLEIEQRIAESGTRNVITAGRPTWADFDLAACQKFLDDSGLESFLAEYQHDFSAIEAGRVLPEYDEALHVITWSEFASVYGARQIPQHWRRDVGHDVGFTDGHLSAWTWITTAAANSRMPGLRFRYRGMTFTRPLLDEMAEAVLARMAAEGEVPDDIQRWRMSHEAKSERDTYRAKFGLPFIACNSGKTAGLAQWRHYLRPDRSKPHPFREDERGPDGLYRLGCPGLFDVVADDQLDAPVDDYGLAVHRRQASSWRYAPDRLSVTGVMETLPMKADEDSADATRMITAEWGPGEHPLTEREQEELALPETLRAEAVLALPPSHFDFALIKRDYELGKVRKERQTRRAHWSHEVVDPTGDPWNNRGER